MAKYSATKGTKSRVIKLLDLDQAVSQGQLEWTKFKTKPEPKPKFNKGGKVK